jgi:hypothetical protein
MLHASPAELTRSLLSAYQGEQRSDWSRTGKLISKKTFLQHVFPNSYTKVRAKATSVIYILHYISSTRMPVIVPTPFSNVDSLTYLKHQINYFGNLTGVSGLNKS